MEVYATAGRPELMSDASSKVVTSMHPRSSSADSPIVPPFVPPKEGSRSEIAIFGSLERTVSVSLAHSVLVMRCCMLIPEARSSHWFLVPSCTRPWFATERFLLPMLSSLDIGDHCPHSLRCVVVVSQPFTVATDGVGAGAIFTDTLHEC